MPPPDKIIKKTLDRVDLMCWMVEWHNCTVPWDGGHDGSQSLGYSQQVTDNV